MVVRRGLAGGGCRSQHLVRGARLRSANEHTLHTGRRAFDYDANNVRP
jgi:hypothetical protein